MHKREHWIELAVVIGQESAESMAQEFIRVQREYVADLSRNVKRLKRDELHDE